MITLVLVISDNKSRIIQFFINFFNRKHRNTQKKLYKNEELLNLAYPLIKSHINLIFSYMKIITYWSTRLLLNPILLDCQSNPNPSQICDCQSKSKSTFQWIDNPIQIQSQSSNLKKNSITANFESFILLLKHVIPLGDRVINTQINSQTFFWIKKLGFF